MLNFIWFRRSTLRPHRNGRLYAPGFLSPQQTRKIRRNSSGNLKDSAKEERGLWARVFTDYLISHGREHRFAVVKSHINAACGVLTIKAGQKNNEPGPEYTPLKASELRMKDYRTENHGQWLKLTPLMGGY